MFRKRFWKPWAGVCTDLAERQVEVDARTSHGVIGELREGPLHRELKLLLAAPGDAFEVRVDGYVIDLVRADGELVEVQTGGFSPLRAKLDALLDRHRMRIVHPIPARAPDRARRRGRRGALRSAPRRSARAPPRSSRASSPSRPCSRTRNLTIEVLLCREDHVRTPAPVRGPPLPARPGERRLIEVLERIELRGPADAAALIPPFDAPFTTRELAKAMRVPLPLAQKTAACLRALEVFEPAGMRGRAPLHAIRPA